MGSFSRRPRLSMHPNYEQPMPKEGEDLVAYTLRCAAFLISPPQLPGESNEIECVDVAAQVLALAADIRRTWGLESTR